MVALTSQQLREAILNSPAIPAPYGEVVNFDAPSPIRSDLLGIITGVFILTTLAVGIRLYTNLTMIKRPLLDDYVIAIGYLLYAGGYQVINYIMIDLKAVGEHQWNVRVRDLIPLLYYLQIAQIIYGVIVTAIKAAIVIQCLRILTPGGLRTTAFWIFHCLLWSHVFFYFISTFVDIFMCNPRAKFWDPTIVGGHCMDNKALNIAAATSNNGSDLILVIVPQIIIWRMNMPAAKKWAVGSVFLVGILACAAATVRLYHIVNILYSTDFTWAATLMGIWTEVEIGCGFLVACMPVFPRFFRHGGFSLTRIRSWRRRDCAVAKNPDARVESIEDARPVRDPVVTDVEFDELVRRTDLSTVPVEDTGHKS